MRLHLVLPAALAVTCVPTLAAQQHTVVLGQGDPIPGLGVAENFARLAIANDGGFYAQVGLYIGTVWSSILVHDGAPFLQPGDPLSGGGVYVRAGQMETDSRGGFVSVPEVLWPGAGQDLPGLVSNHDLVLQPNSPLGFPGAAATGVYQYVRAVRSISPNRFLAATTISNPTYRRALVEIETDAAGQIVGEELFLQELVEFQGTGRTLYGLPWLSIQFAGNERGDRIAYVGLSPSGGAANRALVLNDQVILDAGTPSPVPGAVWQIPHERAVDLNEAGDWVARAALDDGGPWTECIVKNGEVLFRDGDVLPDIAPYALEGSHRGPHVWLTDEGDVVWLGSWRVGTQQRSGVFFNDRLLLADGMPIGSDRFDPSGNPYYFSMSPDTSRVLVGGRLELAPGGTRQVLVQSLLDISETFCSAVPNSTGRISTLSVMGSPRVADNDVTLRATNLPDSSYVHFFTGPTRTFVVQPGSSEGNLCIGGSVGRYAGPGQILLADDHGRVELPIDLNFHPTAQGTAMVQPGETRHFQAWYRDSRNGVPVSNFTDAASVAFE